MLFVFSKNTTLLLMSLVLLLFGSIATRSTRTTVQPLQHANVSNQRATILEICSSGLVSKNEDRRAHLLCSFSALKPLEDADICAFSPQKGVQKEIVLLAIYQRVRCATACDGREARCRRDHVVGPLRRDIKPSQPLPRLVLPFRKHQSRTVVS